jgi:cation-transporting ATPase 13A1
LRCILILTTVVPPELPMILNLAVNNSILYLQKKKIFVSEPKKIPLGGRANVIAFDKTGTLTEDKFIFEGIVDDCSKYQELKTFKNCTNENLVVLAGCHSLISVEKELSGDPIELMFFQLSKWEYTSKNKEARRMLERVIVQKVHPFKSELKRMSTVAEHTSEAGVRKMKVLVKGAP